MTAPPATQIAGMEVGMEKVSSSEWCVSVEDDQCYIFKLTGTDDVAEA